jgi:hypothetical protein
VRFVQCSGVECGLCSVVEWSGWSELVKCSPVDLGVDCGGTVARKQRALLEAVARQPINTQWTEKT